MVRREYVPDRGDIIWLDFEPAAGHEQRGRRPAFVISPKAYNAKSGLLLACPITSQSKGYPFEVACSVSGAEGVILADHLRSLDWRARCARRIVAAPASVRLEVERRILLLVQ